MSLKVVDTGPFQNVHSHPVKIAETVDAAPFTDTDLDAEATAAGGDELALEIATGVLSAEGVEKVVGDGGRGVAAGVTGVATLAAAELALVSTALEPIAVFEVELVKFWCIRFQATSPSRRRTRRLPITPSSSRRWESCCRIPDCEMMSVYLFPPVHDDLPSVSTF